MKELLDVFKVIAPTVATVLGGPLAGLAVEALGSVFGISEPTKDKITTALTQAPLTAEQIVAVKVAEQSLVVKLKELDISLEDLRTKDRVSARGMFKDGIKLIGTIAVLTIIGFTIMVWFVLSGHMKGYEPEEYIIVGTVIGYLASYTQQVYNYFFGSSSGSDKKTDSLTDTIAKMGTNGNGNGNGH